MDFQIVQRKYIGLVNRVTQPDGNRIQFHLPVEWTFSTYHLTLPLGHFLSLKCGENSQHSQCETEIVRCFAKTFRFRFGLKITQQAGTLTNAGGRVVQSWFKIGCSRIFQCMEISVCTGGREWETISRRSEMPITVEEGGNH